MDNVLPTFKTFHLDKDIRQKQQKNRQWNPDDSLPRINQGSSYMSNKSDERRTFRPPAVTSYLIANSQPPNKRYLDAKPQQDNDEPYISPLCSTERGETLPATMKHTSTTVIRKDSAKYQTVPQVLNIENGGGMDDIHIFFTGTKIRSVSLCAGLTELRFVNGIKFKENMSLNPSKIMDFYISTTRRLSSVMSLRQEICVFEFKPGPLGIEVQLKHGKLCCASVVPGSQADAYTNLKESEPLSINGNRIVTLSGFEKALSDAQRCEFSDVIKIEALVLKEEKLPFEDMIGVNLKNKKMSNLFKNVLSKGGKGGRKKRGRRFQTMSLVDSDDDDDEEEDVGNDTPADLEVSSSHSITISGVKAASPKDHQKLEVDDASAQEKGVDKKNEDKGVWQFVSEKENNGDDVEVGRVDTLEELVAGEKTQDINNNNKILPDSNWKSVGADDVAKEEDDNDCDNTNYCYTGNNNDKEGGDDGEEDKDGYDDYESDLSSIQTALMASPNKHRETGFILQSIALGIETVIPPPEEEKVEEPIVEETVEEEQTDATSLEDLGITGAGWDYATALEGGDLTAHLKLICVPERICCSQNGWGEPSQSSFMNFMNISSKWDIELFWVGEDSALISRCILEQNENHVELLSSEHVWCLTARLHDIEELPVECVGDVQDEDVEIRNMSSVSIIFRPPKKNPENVVKRCVRVTWIPWVSLSFAETSTQLARNDTNDYPDVDFKIFDAHSSEEDKGRKK